MSHFFRASATHNIAYKRDNEYSVQLTRWFLKPIGAWPSAASLNIAERILLHSIQFTCHILIMLTVVPCVLYIVFEPNVYLKLKAFGPMIHWLMGGLNYCSLLQNKSEILRCVDHMRSDWRIVKGAEDRKVMLRNAKLGRFACNFCAFFMQGGVFSYSIITGLTSEVVQIDNATTISMHQLPCPFYMGLVDARYSPINEIVLVLQLVSTFIVNTITVGACSLAAVFAMHACGQLNILMARLDELVDRSKNENVTTRRKLAAIVEHHLRVLSFVGRIETVMHQICLVELLGCTTDICMLGYYTITEWELHDVKNLLTYFTIFIAMSCNIFIFCYIAEVLTDQCQKVGDMVYMTDWYYLHHKIALDLIMIISRSNTVIRITAGKMIQLSIATFGDVMKTSFAYLNILRTVTT